MGKIIRKINLFIIITAIVLFVIVALVYLLEERLTVPFQIVLHIAIYMTAYFLIVNSLRILRGLKRRSVRESISLVVLVPIVFGVLTFVYMIADGHKIRFDLTVNKKFSLSPQTVNIVSNLDADVSILAFYKDGQPGREFLKTGLEQYVYHTNKIHFEFIDPDRYPQKAKDNGIESYGEVVVVSERGRERLKGVNNEEQLTNAILKVTTEEKKVLYCVKFLCE